MGIYRRLYIWVEGTDDQRFFNTIVKPRLADRYDDVDVRRYASDTAARVDNFLRGIGAMGAEYIFVSDIDTAPCVTRKKETLQSRFDHLTGANVVIVKAEIESWYLAGLDADACAALGVRPPRDTEMLTKEQFDQLLPARLPSRDNLMIDMLNHYDIETAKQKNGSFAYFAAKYGL